MVLYRVRLARTYGYNAIMKRENSPASSPEFDSYASHYDATVNDAISFSGLKIDFFTRVKADYLLDLVDQLSSPPASAAALLDIGCGIGNFHPLLAGRERNPGIEYAIHDAIHLPYGDGSFDVVYAMNVFHHIPVDVRPRVVGEIRRVLRTKGLFALFEHNPKNPLTTRVVNSCIFDKDAVLVPHRASADLLMSAGFRNVRHRFILTIPAWGKTLRKIDRMFSRLPIGAQYYTVGVAE